MGVGRAWRGYGGEGGGVGEGYAGGVEVCGVGWYGMVGRS